MLPCCRALLRWPFAKVIGTIHGRKPASLCPGPLAVSLVRSAQEVSQKEPPESSWRIYALDLHQDGSPGSSMVGEHLGLYDCVFDRWRNAALTSHPSSWHRITRLMGGFVSGLVACLSQDIVLARLLEPELRSHWNAIETCLHAQPSVTDIYICIYIYIYNWGGARLWVWVKHVKPKAQEITDDLAIIRVGCEVLHMPRSYFWGSPIHFLGIIPSIFWDTKSNLNVVY